MENKKQTPDIFIMDDLDELLEEDPVNTTEQETDREPEKNSEQEPNKPPAEEEKTPESPEGIPETPILAAAAAEEAEPGEEKPQAEEKKPFPWKKIGIVLAILAGLAVFAAAAAYGYGVHYYTSHFLPGTSAEGVALDNLTLAEADQKLTDSKTVEDLRITLITKDGSSVVLDTTPMQIRRHYPGLAGVLSNQDKWRFFLTVEEKKPHSLDYELTYDPAGTQTALQALDICDPEKTEAPVDAAVIQDEKTGEWKVSAATDGNRLDTVILADAVTAAVDARRKEIRLEDTGAYLTAKVREDDPELNRRAKVENAVDAQSFTVNLGADTTREITAEEFRSLLTEGALEEEPQEFLLDEDAFDRFMNSIARSYSTKSASGYRYFKSVTGKRIAMKSDYGWEMDEAATGALVKTMLEEAAKKIILDETATETYPDHRVTAIWKQEALSHGERDFGVDWVEVNITQQKMYCIIGGEIVLESDVVTGTENNKNRRTPSGFYHLRFKSTERDLVGYNSDGTEAYRSHVHYWMPVVSNIGLHDATWRGDFGGDIYLRSGSHGCVNLPLKAAKALYGYIYKDIPVLFYREDKANS